MEMQNTNKVIISIIIVGIFLVVGLIIFDIMQVNTRAVGTTSSIANETLISVDEVGEFLSVSGYRDIACTVNAVLNSSDGVIIEKAGNYTTDNCKVIAATSYYPMSDTLDNTTVTSLIPAGEDFPNSTLLDAVCKIKYCTNNTDPWIVIVASGNYTNATNNGCTIKGVTTSSYNESEILCSYDYTYSDLNPFNNTDWDVSYDYAYTADTVTSNASGNLITSLTNGSSWLTIIVVVAFAVIVLGMLSSGLGNAASKEPSYSY